MARWLSLSAAAALGVAVAGSACGSSAVGIDACKQIEEARCRQAAGCPNISLTPPYAASGSAVDACIRYYDVDCLHGLAVGTEPSNAELQGCLAAIEGSNACGVVAEPQTAPACAWLVPPSTSDAASTANVSDGAPDADGE